MHRLAPSALGAVRAAVSAAHRTQAKRAAPFDAPARPCEAFGNPPQAVLRPSERFSEGRSPLLLLGTIL